ncbi:MAG: GspH/FimT family pseudopilin [Burkholderiaceae bacterium]|jgi:type IV fimbrial biogenesis protein FimT|nr:GspH/FimT family pseudopilin [Burkholderiaceae bacterium]
MSRCYCICATSPRRARARGFTLIEAMVVITISAILLAVGVPMFNGTIASMRASEAANSLVASLEVARAEAIRRGIPVTLCRVTSPAANACDDAAFGGYAADDWAVGWVVWGDVPNAAPAAADVANVIDDNDRLQFQPTLASGSTQRAQIINPGAVTAITFRPDGLRNVGGAAINFRIAYPQAAQGAAVSCRQVSVDISGRVSSSRITC